MQLPSGRVSTGPGPDAPEFSMSPSSYWSWDVPVSLGAGLLVVVGEGLLVVVGAGLLVVVGAGDALPPSPIAAATGVSSLVGSS